MSRSDRQSMADDGTISIAGAASGRVSGAGAGADRSPPHDGIHAYFLDHREGPTVSGAARSNTVATQRTDMAAKLGKAHRYQNATIPLAGQATVSFVSIGNVDGDIVITI